MNHAISKTTMSLPEPALIAGTRAIFGIGLGLLLTDCLSPEQRKTVGWTMFAIGAISTIPPGFEIFEREQHVNTLQPGKDQLRPSA